MFNNNFKISSEDKLCWESEFLPKYEQLLSECSDKIIDQNLLNELTNKSNDLDNEQKKYSSEFSIAKWVLSIVCLVLSVIPMLFITWYWAYKWFTKLNESRKSYLNLINQAKLNKLDVHKKIATSIDYEKFFNSFADVIKYENQGPISDQLIQSLSELSFDDITSDPNSNTYSSSWGIFDENKIVIHKGKQKLREYMETYVGTKLVRDSRIGLDGESDVVTRLIRAEYKHPAFEIINEQTSYAFMESCSNLEFYYNSCNIKKLSNKIFDGANKNYIPMENKEFEDFLNWHRNDEAQFRMFFTPYSQEKYINEFKVQFNKNNKSATKEERKEKDKEEEDDNDDININEYHLDYLAWRKEKSFVFNAYKSSKEKLFWYEIFEKSIQNFKSDHNISVKHFVNSLYKSVIEYYYNIYLSMPFMFLTSIMKSEDQKNVINQIKKDKSKELSDLEVGMIMYNIVSERTSKKIILADTDCFNKMIDVALIHENNNGLLYGSTFEGISFKIQELTKYVRSQGESIPVEYKNYEPVSANIFVYAGKINKDNIYIKQNNSGIYTNIEDKNILNLIAEIESQGEEVIVKNKIFSVICSEKKENENILKLFDELSKK